MYKPKREKFSILVNSRFVVFISLFAVFFGLAFSGISAPALATDSVRTPDPTPTAIGDPIGAVGSPTDSVRFNPLQYSIDKANSPWVVVNKQRPLSNLKYVPALASPPFKFPGTHNPYGAVLTKDAGAAIVKLAKAMADEKAGTMVISSGYRSYSLQVSVHSRQVARFGLKAGEALAARPGYSEHQTGLAADVYALGQECKIYTCFANTKAGKWLAVNAPRFGFIVRYQQGQSATTGYQFEPWHLRYVGTSLATEYTRVKATSLEQFFNLPKAPTY